MKLFIVLSFCLSSLFCFASDDPKVSLETLKKSLTQFGLAKVNGIETLSGRPIPALFFGTHKINSNFEIVDSVKKSHGGTATVFVKDGSEFVRITTNVMQPDGARAIGTRLSHNIAYDTVVKGNTYCGPVDILAKKYETCYEPIKDSTGAVIGIYYVGYMK